MSVEFSYKHLKEGLDKAFDNGYSTGYSIGFKDGWNQALTQAIKDLENSKLPWKEDANGKDKKS